MLVNKRAPPKLSSRTYENSSGFSDKPEILTTCGFIAPTDAEIVHIGLSGIGLYELPSEIAKRRGFYEQEKLETENSPLDLGYR